MTTQRLLDSNRICLTLSWYILTESSLLYSLPYSLILKCTGIEISPRVMISTLKFHFVTSSSVQKSQGLRTNSAQFWFEWLSSWNSAKEKDLGFTLGGCQGTKLPTSKITKERSLGHFQRDSNSRHMQGMNAECQTCLLKEGNIPWSFILARRMHRLSEVFTNHVFKQDLDLVGYILYTVILYITYTYILTSCFSKFPFWVFFFHEMTEDKAKWLKHFKMLQFWHLAETLTRINEYT